MKFGRLLAVGAASAALATGAAEIKSGDTIAFLGDSITQFGWGPGGYVRMCEAAFKGNNLNVRIVPAGISGHKSNQMLARVDKDVISKKPRFMTLSCGVNDVWHGANGVKLEDYKKNITALVDKCQAAGIQVIILASTMIGEDVKNANNQKLAAYNEFLKQLAAEKKCTFVDLNAVMQEQVAAARKTAGIPDDRRSTFLTVDGVHMDAAGNKMMADGVLKALGFNASELKNADAAIAQIGYQPRYNIMRLTIGDYAKLKAKADARKMSVSEFISGELNEKLKELVR